MEDPLSLSARAALPPRPTRRSPPSSVLVVVALRGMAVVERLDDLAEVIPDLILWDLSACSLTLADEMREVAATTVLDNEVNDAAFCVEDLEGGGASLVLAGSEHCALGQAGDGSRNVRALHSQRCEGAGAC